MKKNLDKKYLIAVFIWLGDRWFSRRSVLPGRDCGGQAVLATSFVRALEGRSYRRRPGWYFAEFGSPANPWRLAVIWLPVGNISAHHLKYSSF